MEASALRLPAGRASPRPERDTTRAMSQENVQIVRSFAFGFQHRQHERAFEFYDPDDPTVGPCGW
jgi:hypothetical protein